MKRLVCFDVQSDEDIKFILEHEKDENRSSLIRRLLNEEARIIAKRLDKEALSMDLPSNSEDIPKKVKESEESEQNKY